MPGDLGLVGREAELRRVLGWFDEALTGSPRVVLVAGDAGIGKTSLVTAASGIAVEQGVTTAIGRTTELDGAPPFHPWQQVLRAIGAERLLAPVDSGETDRFSRFDAVTRCLEAIATERGGLLAVLEDMHRADDPSVQLLVHVAERLDSVPVCVLVTGRARTIEQSPAFRTVLPSLMALPGCRRIDLDGLDLDDVRTMLGPDVDDAVVTQSAAITGGNPLFLVESARHLRAGGDPDHIPQSVIEAVRGRLAARSAACVEVLHTAAVFGRQFAAGLVATALDIGAIACLEGIEEAERAGLVEPADAPGRFRFPHLLVRDAVVADLGASARADLHRRIARGIEVYEGTGEAQLADLARHWDAAAVLGEGAVAAHWCEQAARAADARLGWEEAARLYDRAVELDGPSGDPVDRHRRLLGSAQARLHCDDITEAIDRCIRAADTVRDLDRPDLLAAAALVVEGRGGPPLARLRGLAEEALAGSDPDDHTSRARLLGQLATCAFYLDPPSAEPLSAQALRAADQSGEPLARVAAARARQMALAGPESAGERLELASIMGAAGRELGRPGIIQWEPIWRIDALIELGRLPEAVVELGSLRHRVADLGHPISRWHLARSEGLLAQATGRFDDALDWCERACGMFARLEDDLGAAAMYAGFATIVGLHTGFDDDLVALWDDIDLAQAPPFLGDLTVLNPLMAMLGAGDVERAQLLYDRLAPATAWTPPRFLWLHLYVVRLWAAIGLDRPGDVGAIMTELDRHRGLHVAAGAGGITYLGPVELWTGVGSGALGRVDAAVDDLRAARENCTRSGAIGFAVQAGVELARLLLRRGAPSDPDEARSIVAALMPVAARLGMQPWVRSLDDIAEMSGSTRARSGPLSPREFEVAALVAEGLTNRAIASQLYVSERTAQNHVQHILTKLGLSNRTQIATWYADH